MNLVKARRKYLVNYRYQLGQAAIVILSHLLVALLVALLFSWFYLFMLDGAIVCDHNRQLPRYLLGLAVVVTLLTTWWTIRRSHGVVGAVLKIDNSLRDAAQGKFPDEEIVFRENDHFPWMASSLNDCVRCLRIRHEEKNRVLSALLAVQDRIKGDDLNREEAMAVLDAVISELQGGTV